MIYFYDYKNIRMNYERTFKITALEPSKLCLVSLGLKMLEILALDNQFIIIIGVAVFSENATLKKRMKEQHLIH